MPNRQDNHKPLSDAEFEELSEFLQAADAPMNLEMLDGFMAALICSPDVVMPSEYLPMVLGEDHVFESEQQATAMLALLIRHWNSIAAQLQHALKKPDVYLPILLEGADGTATGNDWAHGFMQGTLPQADAWAELMTDEERGGPMVSIMLLAHEHDPDPELRPPPITPEAREDILATMVGGLTLIYRYFAPQRAASAGAPYRRTAQKIGRNQPCPCGSGRKYKRCCGRSADASNLH